MLQNVIYHHMLQNVIYHHMLQNVIYHHMLQNVIYSRMTSHFIQQGKTLCKLKKMRQLSDLSLRLSLAGQNIENVTKHHLLGLIVDNKFRWQALIEHLCKSMSQNNNNNKNTTCFSFLSCNVSSTSTPEKIPQRAHKTSHRLCVSSVGWLWRITSKIELPTSKGRQMNPS